MSRKISITIDANGQTTIEAFGHIGGACKKATAPLRGTLIGEQPDVSTLKPEFYQADVANRLNAFEGGR